MPRSMAEGSLEKREKEVSDHVGCIRKRRGESPQTRGPKGLKKSAFQIVTFPVWFRGRSTLHGRGESTGVNERGEMSKKNLPITHPGTRRALIKEITANYRK